MLVRRPGVLHQLRGLLFRRMPFPEGDERAVKPTGAPFVFNLIVTMDDATGAIYSAFLVEEEGTASTFRALQEVFETHGLPMSLYTDRRAHYFCTTKAGEIDRSHPTQVGRALEQLGVEHIGAFSPQAGGRSERAFQTLQNRLVNDLALAGVTDIEAANAFIRNVYLPAHNARFAVDPAGEGSAFTAVPGVDLAEILCVQEERQVGNDNCVSYRTLKLQIPESPMRPISSRRGSRSTSTPTAPMPSSTGRAASAGTTPMEVSKMRKTPLKSARRRSAVDGMDKPPACPPPHSRTKAEERTLDALPKLDNLIRYRQEKSPLQTKALVPRLLICGPGPIPIRSMPLLFQTCDDLEGVPK